MEDFEELRKKYNCFIFDDYKIMQEDNDTIEITFYFEILGLKKFKPTIEISKLDIDFDKINTKTLKAIAFNMGMIELISYWKVACPKRILIECGKLTQEQIDWFKKIYYNGLSEFRYINHIEKIPMDELFQIECNCRPEYANTSRYNETSMEYKGALIPVGGGKDSCVTLELLKEHKKDNLCLVIGDKAPQLKEIKKAGYKDDQIIHIKRTIDKRLLELNEKGFLNGHTPFSAMLAFTSYFVAYLSGKKYIPVSNEQSSNESNIKGEKINHQYSKSFEFEEEFRWYINNYLEDHVQYFSMLRPLNELQIAKLFSNMKKYHKIFRSCNIGSKETPWKWCCNCSKCLFVFIILSPYLYKKRLVKIFKKDLYENKDLLNTFIELCGYGEVKPFECVGTSEEVNYAISKTIKQLEIEGKELPYLLNYYKENYKLVDTNTDIEKRYNEENNVPKEFEKLLKDLIFNDENEKI